MRRVPTGGIAGRSRVTIAGRLLLFMIAATATACTAAPGTETGGEPTGGSAEARPATLGELLDRLPAVGAGGGPPGTAADPRSPFVAVMDCVDPTPGLTGVYREHYPAVAGDTWLVELPPGHGGMPLPARDRLLATSSAGRPDGASIQAVFDETGLAVALVWLLTDPRVPVAVRVDALRMLDDTMHPTLLPETDRDGRSLERLEWWGGGSHAQLVVAFPEVELAGYAVESDPPATTAPPSSVPPSSVGRDEDGAPIMDSVAVNISIRCEVLRVVAGDSAR